MLDTYNPRVQLSRAKVEGFVENCEPMGAAINLLAFLALKARPEEARSFLEVWWTATDRRSRPSAPQSLHSL